MIFLKPALFDQVKNQNVKDPDLFFQICHKTLNNHTLPKKKCERGNDKSFVPKRCQKL